MSSPYEYPSGNPGGFKTPLKPASQKGVQKMKWTPENDRKLLIYTSYRDVLPFEHAKIAAMFPEKPTPKAIAERLVKLKNETMRSLADAGIYRPGDDSETPGPSEPEVAGATPGGLEQGHHNTIGEFTGFTPVNLSKKRPASKMEINDDEPAALNRAPAPKKQRKAPRLELAPPEELVPNTAWLGGLDPNAAPRSGDPVNRRNAGVVAGGEEIAPRAAGEQEGGIDGGVGAGGEEVGGAPSTEQGEGGAAGAGAVGGGSGAAGISQEQLEAAHLLLNLSRNGSGR